MIVTFLGVPCSGKTTTATKLFADLKEAGIPAEFVPEYARQYIASLKYDSPGEDVKLDDGDQISIMVEQARLERVFAKACGPDVVLVVDGCALNTLLYLSSGARQNPVVQSIVKMSMKAYDVVFVCEPVQALDGLDPNRIHSWEESLQLNGVLESLLLKGPLHGVPGVTLRGDPGLRFQTAQKEIYGRFFP